MFQVSQNNGRGQWRAFSTQGITPLAMTALVIGLSVASLPLLAQNHGHGHGHAGPADSAVTQVQDPLAKLQPAQQYTCSMHPQIRLSDPNERCPICGMALIPVAAEDGHTASGEQVELRLSPRAAALLQTAVMPVRQAASSQHLSLPGTLVADQSRVQTISAWTSGRIEQAYVNRTAQQVQAGEPMLEIFSPELIVIQQELLQAKQLSARSSLPAGSTLDGARRRLRLLGVPSAQIEHILQREQLQDTVTVSAPVSGIVTEKFVNQGAYVSTGQPLFTVLALDKLWLELAAFESQLPLLQVGQQVEVSVKALPGETLSGRIELIEPELNIANRNARVRVLLANPDGRLKPGMLAQASIQAEVKASLLVPASAVLFTGKQSLVYVQPDPAEPRYEPRQVELGLRLGEEYQLLSGVSAGELVVTQGAFRLDSELQIRGLPSMLNPAVTPTQHATATASHTHSAPQVAATPAPNPDGFVVPAEAQSVLLQAYTQAYEALVADDLAGWQQATLSLQQAVAAVDWPERFPRVLSTLNAGAGEIMDVTEIAQARALFYRHNLGLLRFAELGVLADGWYEAYCPMARDGEGASWLQREAELRNPYFGAMMLRCGDIVRRFGAEG
ncbi:efflux RND transporter periplasmic adaptor subunit [Rheinheimera soli]|uniref:efflux RND transporter periplasmic adaptor subunit n=1 Tax=Rheinheimera soli TaxID=443616 RepID=UPI001E552B55|nr:efflux RND transporter periplasmic adaptor subunit [Rheinheimera soli]